MLWSIDRWSDHHNVLEYFSAAGRLARFGERSRVRRCTFTEAAAMIPDGGFTLEEWWPKLRRGGIFAGHDYHPDWPATMQAVDAFVAGHKGLELGRTAEYVKDREWPSWYLKKP